MNFVVASQSDVYAHLYRRRLEIGAVYWRGEVNPNWCLYASACGRGVVVANRKTREIVMLWVKPAARLEGVGRELVLRATRELGYVHGRATETSVGFYARVGCRVEPDGKFVCRLPTKELEAQQ